MDMPASSSAPAPTKRQLYLRARRKERIAKLPQTMAISTGLFLCLAALQGQFGVFDDKKSVKYGMTGLLDLGAGVTLSSAIDEALNEGTGNE